MPVAGDTPAAASAATCLDAVAWDERGLAPAIAQDAGSGRVLMLAWMNRDALAASIASGFATYWSRSRAQLWRKGESSGHRQRIVDMRLDCDGDTLLLQVEQMGGIACHTGRASCFYRALDAAAGGDCWTVRDPVLKNPDDIYSHE
ncbi:MAG TPA: phosphoribosyl-AMP cyclohydrolase [Salinisphaeraceae bacterium]|nr:phosphoribosyl-AMP cyclohydrolase [Salinisphaeraceae bacterium]